MSQSLKHNRRHWPALGLFKFWLYIWIMFFPYKWSYDGWASGSAPCHSLSVTEPPVPDNSTTLCLTNSIIFTELSWTTFPWLVLKFSHPFPPNTSTPLGPSMGSPWAARRLSGRHFSFHCKTGRKVVILYSAEVLTSLLPCEKFF